MASDPRPTEIPAEDSPISTAAEQRQVEERTAVPVNVVYEAIRREGETELVRPAAGLAWSGLAAGLSMGFSFIAEALLESHIPNTRWRPLISKLGYSIGFLIVVLGRQQLFTENTLTAILPVLLRTEAHVFRKVVRLWGIVLSANLLGAFLFAFFVGKTALFPEEV